MKKLFSTLFAIVMVVGLSAQTTKTWFDGNVYYTSTVVEGGLIYFEGVSADKESTYSFGLDPLGEGAYNVVKMTDIDTVPIRFEFGSEAHSVVTGNLELFMIYDAAGDLAWVLQKTKQSHRDALATQLWTKDQPVKKMLASMVLNPFYFSDFSKSELMFLVDHLSQKQEMNYLESLNLSLMLNELSWSDYFRYNVANPAAISEAVVSEITPVSDAQSFLNALTSGAIILVEDNTIINLSEVLNDRDYFSFSGRGWIEEYGDRGSANLISESVFNGRQLVLRDLHDVTIVGGYNSHIVVDPAYAYVLKFESCSNIHIANLTMGHTVEGYCTGGVVGLEGCEGVIVEKCDLYGCGAYGLVAVSSTGVEMHKSIIRDCSYGIMQLSGVKDAVFVGCDFIRNREFTMVEIDAECSNIRFEDSRFAQNKGVLFSIASRASMKNCLVYHGDVETLGTVEEQLLVDEATQMLITDMPLGKRAVGPDSEQ